MDATKLRCRGDIELSNLLKQDRLVSKVIEQLSKQEEKTPRATRRRLLATALRLTPAMSPQLNALIEECRQKLNVETDMETYVYSSPQVNAACVKPEDGRLFILLSSSLLEAFQGSELRFVVGHELGHHLYGHHDIPIGVILDGKSKPSPELALRLFSWSRYAEISADRAGAACAGDGDAVATALFRLASGIRGDLINISIDALASQVDDMRAEASAAEKRTEPADWFSTHPFSPLRVQALKYYNSSVLAQPEGASVDVLEAQMQSLMSLMEPSYLDEKTQEAETMRRLLFAGAIAVADAHDGICDAEVAAFEKFFGEGRFDSRLDVNAIKADLPQRIDAVKAQVRDTRRIQVLRDLCIVARADGKIDEREAIVMRDIAHQLSLSDALVDQTLYGNVDPD